MYYRCWIFTAPSLNLMENLSLHREEIIQWACEPALCSELFLKVFHIQAKSTIHPRDKMQHATCTSTLGHAFNISIFQRFLLIPWFCQLACPGICNTLDREGHCTGGGRGRWLCFHPAFLYSRTHRVSLVRIQVHVVTWKKNTKMHELSKSSQFIVIPRGYAVHAYGFG